MTEWSHGALGFVNWAVTAQFTKPRAGMVSGGAYPFMAIPPIHSYMPLQQNSTRQLQSREALGFVNCTVGYTKPKWIAFSLQYNSQSKGLTASWLWPVLFLWNGKTPIGPESSRWPEYPLNTIPASGFKALGFVNCAGEFTLDWSMATVVPCRKFTLNLNKDRYPSLIEFFLMSFYRIYNKNC